ncbi:PEP/pyruvate-binding domain-containing protein [Actinoplanes sp. ATCC 53533]|uniref:PEP/pyruvate-binding domain-containing protein n=1 Tax=Actinoplanes sp. ATCC 53533 TaxID=1288362 RepID=UPI00131523F8|nr:PEP/pyruvate-binding domain-containing protein [Actinoplanes sp. ATCC 53533]
METHPLIVDLTEAGACGRAVVGGKAAVLGDLLVAGFAVPAGVVVRASARGDPGLGELLTAAAGRLGADRFAVRSSAAGEDLPDASYAGLYETYLDVPAVDLGDAVRRCFASADADRVAGYRQRHGGAGGPMAVLVQEMVDPVAAGVAFTAHPVTGAREQTIVAAVPGVGDPLMSGAATGEEWTVTAGVAAPTRAGPTPVLNADRASAVAALAGRVADRYDRPQDVEWAIDRAGRLWLLQARPMTALPDPVSWTPPGPGLWMRNFRLGEWLPEPVTPLFATWLLPMLEHAYLDGMHGSVGVRVPFRWALVNGWYYNATPIPSPALLARVLTHGRRRAVRVLYHALIQVGRNPAAADRAVLADLARQWRDHQAPRYRHLITEAEAEAEVEADPRRLIAVVDRLGREAGISLWYLAIVGGSAWKMEACLTRFVRKHLAEVVPDSAGGAQVLLRGLPGTEPVTAGHAVHSMDWYHPTAGELPPPAFAAGDRHTELAAHRDTADQRCAAALADRPGLLTRYRHLVEVTQRYAVIREQQARELTLAWPVLRSCARRLGAHLADAGLVGVADDVFFCTRTELDAALAGHTAPLTAAVAERRRIWERQRRLPAPLTMGRPPRLAGDVIERMVQQARGPADAHAAIVGHPASAGQATGLVRILTGPADFASLVPGDVLVAPATTPVWIPLFARAAAVVTDGGTLAAHASLVAREYGIPAVVGTGNATRRLRNGQRVTVNGTAGTVTVHDQTGGEREQLADQQQLHGSVE